MKVGGAVGKDVGIKIDEMFFSRELRENLLECWFEKISEPKKMAALRDVHCPKLSRPFVHLLENVAMNRFQVVEIELTCESGLSINSARR